MGNACKCYIHVFMNVLLSQIYIYIYINIYIHVTKLYSQENKDIAPETFLSSFTA